MPTLTIRNVPQVQYDALKARAARSGRSMEAEARRALDGHLGQKQDRAAFEEAVRAAQAAFAGHRAPGLLASEELIAERRLEAWRGTVESNEWLTQAAGRGGPDPDGDARS